VSSAASVARGFPVPATAAPVIVMPATAAIVNPATARRVVRPGVLDSFIVALHKDWRELAG
jgi:hypothetical protein